MTVRLRIDGRQVEAEKGSTILAAADRLGISVPTMCFVAECGPITSCMVCAVKDKLRGSFIPACSATVMEGMDIDTCSNEVSDHRRTALELLLSEHSGDCEGPCRRGCPAYMDIPEMLRLIASGDMKRAIKVVKEDIPLPGVLGRICPAPCEKVCRRNELDGPVRICAMKRAAADYDLASGNPYIPETGPSSGKSTAVIGAGPAGLSAAFFLRRLGHAVSVYEKSDRPGGSLRDEWAAAYEIESVIDAEAQIIRSMGVEFRLGCEADAGDLAGRYDAVIIASGLSGGGLHAQAHTYATDRKGVFAAGSVVRPVRMAVIAVGHARAAACSVDQYLRGESPSGRRRRFDSRLVRKKDGHVRDAANPGLRRKAEASGGDAAEASRCLDCDCLKKHKCMLRDLSDDCKAVQNAYSHIGPASGLDDSHTEIIYEPGKCIKCGLCVKISRRCSEGKGVGFVNRGVDVLVTGAYDEKIRDALKAGGEECASHCPTGAISLKAVYCINSCRQFG